MSASQRTALVGASGAVGADTDGTCIFLARRATSSSSSRRFLWLRSPSCSVISSCLPVRLFRKLGVPEIRNKQLPPCAFVPPTRRPGAILRKSKSFSTRSARCERIGRSDLLMQLVCRFDCRFANGLQRIARMGDVAKARNESRDQKEHQLQPREDAHHGVRCDL